MTIMLDTSLIIDALRRRRERRELLRALLEAGHELACCAINVAQVHSGVLPHEAHPTAEFIDSLKHSDITRQAACNAGVLRVNWRRKGITLSLPDAIIDAVALREGLTL